MSEIAKMLLAHQEAVSADYNRVGGDNKVIAFIEKGAMIFVYNGKKDGLYYHYEDIDEKAIAEKLGASPRDIFLAKEEAKMELLRSNRLFDEIIYEISQTVADDNTLKKVLFLTYLSAYIPDRTLKSLPLNLFIKGESACISTLRFH